jgi:hypothetical protein
MLKYCLGHALAQLLACRHENDQAVTSAARKSEFGRPDMEAGRFGRLSVKKSY